MRELIRHILREHSLEISELKKIGPDEFISKAKEVHGDYYDYSQTQYKTMRDKVNIICPKHGAFPQSPGHHLNGSGCPKCGTEREATKWTDDELRKEALKYEVYSDFINQSPSAYQTAKKKRSKEFLEDITKHMSKTTRWTDEALKNEASKYKTRGEFQINNPVAYTTSLRRGILDDICSHMERAGSKYLRYIYAYEFPDNSVYIGLTYNLDERHISHMNSPTSTVFIHMQNTGLVPIRKTVTELLDSQEASKTETRILDEYEKKGWKVLNRAKTGNLGGTTLFWTEERIKNEIKKYKTLNDFYLGSSSAFQALRKLGKEKYEELTKNLKKTKEKLSDEEIEILAGMYDNKMDFFKSEPKAYSQAKRKGQEFFDKVTSHMVNQKTYWTDEMLKDESSKYPTRNKFAKGSPSAYTTSRRRGLLDKFFPKK